MSVYLGWSIYRSETRTIASDFRLIVDRQTEALEKKLVLNLESLYALKGLFDSSMYVTPLEFGKLAQSILIRHDDIQALEWLPKVAHSERALYVKRRREAFPAFEFTEIGDTGELRLASERDFYYPVYYLEPLAGNENAFGFDAASGAVRYQTLKMSIDKGKPVTSKSVTLVQETGRRKGTITFVPVYNGLPTSVEMRHKMIKGFVVGVYRIEDIVNKALNINVLSGINLMLADITDADIEILHQYAGTATVDEILQSTFKYQRLLTNVDDRQWAIIAAPDSDYISTRRGVLPYLTLVLGLLVILMGTFFTLCMVRRTDQIERISVDLDKRREVLEELSQTDSLTNIANRRHFDESFKAEWDRGIRAKTSLSLILIDIDKFKNFNDRYGHLAGDACLKEVAVALRKTTSRSIDLVARYGGEEFVIILSNTSDAASVAESCRLNIESLQILHEDSGVSRYVTISLGVATVVPEQSTDMISFFQQADTALYEAKKSGRNRVCLA